MPFCSCSNCNLFIAQSLNYRKMFTSQRFPERSKGFSAAGNSFLELRRQFAMYHLCFWENIYMWLNSFNWEKELNLPWEYQALKPAPFPHANIQCHDEQNGSDQSGSDLNVAMYQSRNQSQYKFGLPVGAHQCWVSLKLQLLGGIQGITQTKAFRQVLNIQYFKIMCTASVCS